MKKQDIVYILIFISFISNIIVNSSFDLLVFFAWIIHILFEDKNDEN